MLAADLPDLLLSAADPAAAADNGAAPPRLPLRGEPVSLSRKLGYDPPPVPPPADDRGGVVGFPAPLGPPVVSPPPSSSMLSAPLEPADAEFLALLSSNAASATGPVGELDVLFDESVDEAELARREDIPVDGRIERLRCILSRAVGNGDARRVERILNQVPREFIDLNAKDEEGSAPLIYAACFGHMEVAFLLLEAGADPDIQDKCESRRAARVTFGRRPPVPELWAAKNNHYAFARMLVEYGAKTSTKTAKGRTAMDFARHSDLRLAELFTGNIGRSDPASQGDRPTFDDLEFYSSGGVDEEAFQSERNFM
ncbi:MAG: ankyrin repeat-containing domain protein, partial [Olpidium bornovanus]